MTNAIRAHFNRPILDSSGNSVLDASVRVLQPDVDPPVPITDTLYADDSSQATLPNPFTVTSGVVDFYLLNPERVSIGITVGSLPEQIWNDLDVSAVGVDSLHPGTGSDSVQVGIGATASASQATALGDTANASGASSIALGAQSAASASSATGVGSAAVASGASATAVGAGATAAGLQGTALGAGASAAFEASTAVGEGATTTTTGQVMLGKTGQLVEVAGTLVMTSPAGNRYALAVDDTGRLTTIEQAPLSEGS